MSRRSSIHCGLTLIEVVAGIAILATLLVSILVAHQKHSEQIRKAQQRLAAIEELDRLLAEWSAAGTWQPVGSEGKLEDLQWRVVLSDERVPDELAAEVVRVEVFSRDQVLASVELLSESSWPGEGLRP